MHESPPLRRLRHPLVFSILDHLLQHPAACLVEAVEVESVENLNLLRSQHLHLGLHVVGNAFIEPLLGQNSFTCVLCRSV